MTNIRVSIKHNFAWQNNIIPGRMCIYVTATALYADQHISASSLRSARKPSARSCLHHPSSPACKIRTNNRTETVPNLARSKCTGVCECAPWQRREAPRSLLTQRFVGSTVWSRSGRQPAVKPLPKTPSPRSESNGDRSPSAIPRARREEGERRELVLLCYRESVCGARLRHAYVRCCGNACAHPCARGVYCMMPKSNTARHAVNSVRSHRAVFSQCVQAEWSTFFTVYL